MINAISSKQGMKTKKINNSGIIGWSILRTNIIRTVRLTVKKITNEILGILGSVNFFYSTSDTFPFLFTK